MLIFFGKMAIFGGLGKFLNQIVKTLSQKVSFFQKAFCIYMYVDLQSSVINIGLSKTKPAFSLERHDYINAIFAILSKFTEGNPSKGSILPILDL